MKIELESYFSTISTNGFTQIGIEEPDSVVFFTVDVPIRYFEKFSKYEYKKTKDPNDIFDKGRSIWEIFKRNVDEVTVFTDNIESGLFLSANFNGYQFIFAKLCEDCELYDIVTDKFHDLMNQNK